MHAGSSEHAHRPALAHTRTILFIVDEPLRLLCVPDRVTNPPLQMKNPVLVTGIALSFLIGCSGSTREDKAVSRTVDLEVPREESTPEPTAAADAESDKNGDIMNTSDSWTILGGSGLASTFAVANEASVGSAISSSAARQGTDTTHRFIRTADLRFRVKNVIKATLRIEDIVGAHHGWVAKTELRSDPQGQCSPSHARPSSPWCTRGP